MGNKVLVLGDSGSGKSTSTRNLDPKSTFYINIIGKPLPFRGWKAKYKDVGLDKENGNYFKDYQAENVLKCIAYVNQKRPDIKTLIVDDAQYIMSYEFMDRAKERGFDKFTEIGQNMFKVLKAPDATREDLTTIFLCHSEDVSANGYTKTKMKTIGKMLDDKITIEGMFTMVLLAYCHRTKEGGNTATDYVFITQSNGTNTVKTPMDMFKEVMIPNDLSVVIDAINKYEEEG